MPKLIDCFPEWDSSGGSIFTTLASISDARQDFPWLQYASLLDLEYIGNHSGEKTVSPLIDKYIKKNENRVNPEELTNIQRLALANILYRKFTNKWTRLYAVEQAEYDPIQNYSMKEEETPDITRRHSVSTDYAAVSTHTTDRDITRTEGVSNDYEKVDERKTKTDFDVITTSDTDASMYAFNSNSPVPTNEASGDSTVRTTGAANDNVITDTHRQTGSTTVRETADANDNIEQTTNTQTGYTQDTETGTRSLTRSGNIGVTTSQQMLESEIALWQWNFFESVYADVDSVLTTQIYD